MIASDASWSPASCDSARDRHAAPLMVWEHVSCGYRGRLILYDLSFSLQPGEITGLLGPNGGGKTTLLKTMAGIIPPASGRILFSGFPIRQLSRRRLAQKVAIVPQDLSLIFPFTVREVAMMGRFPHQNGLGFENGLDQTVVREALEAVDAWHLRDRRVTEVSGGERSRAFVARALAQSPSLLLLDEPTAFLDLRYQLELYQLVNRLCREKQLAVMAACHDVNLISRHAHRLIFLKEGRIVADGTPFSVLSASLFKSVYGLSGRLIPVPDQPEIPPLFVAMNEPTDHRPQTKKNLEDDNS